MQSSLVPRPFLVGGVRKGRGRKGLVNNPTPMWIHRISLMYNNQWLRTQNTYKFTLNMKPHVHTTHSHEILFTTHTYLTFGIFPHQHCRQECSRGSVLRSSYSPDTSFLSPFLPHPLEGSGNQTRCRVKAYTKEIQLLGTKYTYRFCVCNFPPQICVNIFG